MSGAAKAVDRDECATSAGRTINAEVSDLTDYLSGAMSSLDSIAAFLFNEEEWVRPPVADGLQGRVIYARELAGMVAERASSIYNRL